MSIYLNKEGRRINGTLVRIDALEVGDPADKEKARRYSLVPTDQFPLIHVVGRKVMDGFHRVAAAKLRGETTIAAEGSIVGDISVKW